MERRWTRAVTRLEKHEARAEAGSEAASYQFLLAGLVAARLRVLRMRRPELHLRFLVACDVRGAEPFDDLVVHLRWDYQGRRRLLSYLVLLAAEAGARVDWFREDLRLVVVTRGPWAEGGEGPGPPAHLDFPFEGVFHTGCGRRDFVAADAADPHAALRRKLCVFSEQADVACLGRQVAFALEDALGGSVLYSADAPRRYATFLREWWGGAAGDCLSDDSTELEAISLAGFRTALVVVPGIPQEARASRLQPALAASQPGRFAVLTQRALRSHPLPVLESMCAALCDEVALAVDELDAATRAFVQRLLTHTRCRGLEMALRDLEEPFAGVRGAVRGAALGALALDRPVALGAALPAPGAHLVARTLLHRSAPRAVRLCAEQRRDHVFLGGFPRPALAALRRPDAAWAEPWALAGDLAAAAAALQLKTTWSAVRRRRRALRRQVGRRQGMHWRRTTGRHVLWSAPDGDPRSLARQRRPPAPPCRDAPLCAHAHAADFSTGRSAPCCWRASRAAAGPPSCCHWPRRCSGARARHWVLLLSAARGPHLGHPARRAERATCCSAAQEGGGHGADTPPRHGQPAAAGVARRAGNPDVLVDGVDEALRAAGRHGCQSGLAAETGPGAPGSALAFDCGPALSLQPLGARDQLAYLLRRWRGCVDCDDERRAEDGMAHLVHAIREATLTDGAGLCDAPLYMHMLAEAYMNDLEVLQRGDVADLAALLTPTAVCARFVRKSLNAICCSGGDLLALDTCVDDSSVKKHTLYAAMECFASKHALVDGRPIFVHRCVAEFLAALWLRDHFASLPETLAALYDGLFAGVRLFFDALLAEERALAAARADVEAEDRGGRRALHLAAICARLGAVQRLLRAGADARARDA
ncbi:LOW QUALITY PROTEIN: Uncharacterized protein GBIM_16604, partial [Gryllus bimaculatus]